MTKETPWAGMFCKKADKEVLRDLETRGLLFSAPVSLTIGASGAVYGLMGALLVVSKQAMSGIPNVELVTLLIILFALELPRETPGAVMVFLVLQGVLYGFGLWWAMYLYVWYLLAVLAWLLRRMDNAFGWAVFSGAYGLCFGGLCAAVYLFAKTPAFALSWWLSGLSYDALHGVGNFVLMLLLYRPLCRALQMAKKQLRV